MIFRYPGGKSKSSIKRHILGRFPKEFNEYREPFLGGGGIFFALDLIYSIFNSVEHHWINDINSNLIEVYKALRDRSEEFIKSCRNIPEVSKEVFDSFSYNEKCDQALRFFLINRTVWSGRVNYDPAMKSRMYFSNPQGWNIVKTNKLECAAQLLNKVKITHCDFDELLCSSGENCFLYLDPPYVKNTELSNMSKLYAFNFTMDDHQRLRDKLKECKHKFLLSYDDHELIRAWYGEYNIDEVSFTYCGSSLEKKETGKELIIRNY